MITTKKQMFLLIGSFILVILLGTVTYAFFNYTRTGTANIIRTGRINFSSEQGTSINLTNIFPVDVSEGIPNDPTKIGSVTINVTGDTTYGEGIEYLVSAVNVTNSVGNKTLPISIDVVVSSNTHGESPNQTTTTLGTANTDYFEDRGNTTSYYQVLAGDTIEDNSQLVIGYIAPGAQGVDGNIVIRAYLDASKVAISDTYPEATVRTVITSGYSSSACETILDGASNVTPSTVCATAASLQDAIDNEDLTTAQINALVIGGIVEEYTDGTTSEWVDDRETFTTSEWNALQTNGVSFQVKVEANEGIWVEEIRSINVMNSIASVNAFMNQDSNIKEIYFNKIDASTMQNSYDMATIKADLTYNNEGKVLAWLETNSIDNTKYNLIIASDGDTYLNTGKDLFAGWASNVDKIEFNNINTSRVTDMDSMFDGCSKLTTLDLSGFDTTNVTNMFEMFLNCSMLTDINLSSFNTTNVENMEKMFSGCSSIAILDLSSFNTSNVSNMNFMFIADTSLVKIYVSNNWSVDNVTSSTAMFVGCSSIEGGSGTVYDSSKFDKTMAIIDGGSTNPGYLTLKTN